MQLGEFHTLVSASLKRGASLDSVIPSKVRQAVRFLERNFGMKYMESWIELQLDVTDQIVEFPWAFRNIKFLRTASRDYGYLYFRKFRPEEQEAPTLEFSAYSQIGTEAIRFSSPPPYALRIEGIVSRFTDWQTTQDDFRHYLLDVAEDLLLYQTLIGMAVYLKDERMLMANRQMRDEALKSFNAMDYAQQEDGLDEAMEYRGLR